MKRFALVVALIAMPLLVACGTGIPSSQTYATVYGRVYDATSNAPVAGAVVSVDTAYNVTSGSDGTYTATNVPIGQTDVLITAPPGYSAASQPSPFSVTAGERYHLDIPLTAAH